MSVVDYGQFKQIKDKLLFIYNSSNVIHVSLKNGRKIIKNAKSKLIGVYDRFAIVESLVNNYMEKFTINYIDLVTKNILINEL